jgi:hypothetical protein
MTLIQQNKFFHFTHLKNTTSKYSSFDLGEIIYPTGVKCFKVKVRKNLIYIVELYYYNEYVFIKFHPKIHESNPKKYQLVGMGLKNEEIRKLLNTCCKIVLYDIDKNDSTNLVYAFFGQWYDKDNSFSRLISKRFSLYEKQVATFFSESNFHHFRLDITNFYSISSIENKRFIPQIKALFEKLLSNDEIISLFMTERAKNEYMVSE